MVALPDVTPVTIPDPEPTVATDVLPLLQVPEGVVFDRVVVEPTHTDCVPVMALGSGFTVAVRVMKQLVGSV